MTRSLIPVVLVVLQCLGMLAVCRGDVTPAADQRRSGRVVLGDFARGTDGWTTYLGDEFPGAKGGGQWDSTTSRAGKASLRLVGDFTGGGRYVAAMKTLAPPLELRRLRIQIKSESLSGIMLRVTDASGQTHQQSIRLEEKPDWQEVVVTKLEGTTSWGGAKDGRWHGPATEVAILVDASQVRRGDKVGSLWLDDVIAEVSGDAPSPATAPVVPAPAAPSTGRARKIEGKLELDRTLPYFWGRDDAPRKVTLAIGSDDPNGSVVTAVRVLNHEEESVAELWKGQGTAKAGRPFRQELGLSLPAYGVYYIEADVAGARRPVRTSLAWLAGPAPLWPEGPFGVQMHFTHGGMGSHNQLGDAQAALELVKRMGASWIREEGDGKPNAGSPFAYDAARVKLGLHEYNLIVRYVNGQPPVTPEARKEYCRLAQEIVRSKGADVTLYEVWNEPNIAPGWKGRKPSAQEYTDLLKDAYIAIKAANPKTIVVGACTAGVDYRFIEEVLKLGGGQYMDAISVHPYHPVAPELISTREQAAVGTGYSGGVPFTFVGRMQQLKALLDRYHAGHLRIWLSEMGYVTGDLAYEVATFSASEVARYNTRQMIQALTLPFVERSFIYSFQDRYLGGRPDRWDFHMGLVEVYGAPKPGYVAYNTMARKLYRTKFVTEHPIGEGLFCYEFAGESGAVLAAWAVNGAGTLSLSADPAGAAVTDLMGNERVIKPVGGRVTVALTEYPVFVVGSQGLSAKPAVVSLTGDLSGTQEGTLHLTLVANPALGDGPWTVAGPAGWKTVVEGSRVSLTAPVSAASGAYPVVARCGEMSAGVTLKLNNSVLVSVLRDQADLVAVTLENPFPSPRTVLLKPRTADGPLAEKTLEVPGGGKVKQLVAVKCEVADGWVTVPMALNLRLAESQTGTLQYTPGSSDRLVAGVTPCYPVPKNAVDVDLTAWESLKPCLLGRAEHWVPAGTEPYGGLHDISARFWTGWDQTNLHVAAEVTDDKHVQAEKDAELWRGDSIQFVFAVGGNRFAFDVAAGEDGRTRVWERMPNAGVPAEVRAVAKIEGVKTRYEIEIPWKHLSVSAPGTSPMTFALLVNDNDGAGRKGWLEWFGGLGGTKDPAQYGPLLLKQ